MSSTWLPSCFRRACNPATRSADGPISTPRRLAPKSIGTPMMRIFWGMRFVRLAPRRHDRGQFRGHLRIDAIQHTWEGDHFADVLRSANPCHGAFEAQAEACVRNAAVAAQVEIPLKGLFGQVVLAGAREQVARP